MSWRTLILCLAATALFAADARADRITFDTSGGGSLLELRSDGGTQVLTLDFGTLVLMTSNDASGVAPGAVSLRSLSFGSTLGLGIALIGTAIGSLNSELRTISFAPGELRFAVSTFFESRTFVNSLASLFTVSNIDRAGSATIRSPDIAAIAAGGSVSITVSLEGREVARVPEPAPSRLHFVLALALLAALTLSGGGSMRGGVRRGRMS